MKWIPLLSLILFAQINTVLGQDTIYHNHAGFDTLIIIKKEVIVKEKVVQTIDTIRIIDTLYKTQTDTLHYRKPRRIRKTASKGIHLKVGLVTGLSGDFGDIEARPGEGSFTKLYESTTSAKTNTSFGINLQIERDYFTILTGIEQYNYREEFNGQEFSDTRKFRYSVWYTSIAYSPVQTEKFLLGLGFGIGLHTNFERIGIFINPNDFTEEGTDDDFLELRKTILTNYIFVPMEFFVTPSFSFTATPFLNFRPSSITSSTQPFEYRRNDIGIRVGFNYTLF